MTPNQEKSLEFVVSNDDEGLRLDAFLVEHCPDLSRTSIQADLKEGHATVNDRKRPKSFRLKTNNKVIYFPQ